MTQPQVFTPKVRPLSFHAPSSLPCKHVISLQSLFSDFWPLDGNRDHHVLPGFISSHGQHACVPGVLREAFLLCLSHLQQQQLCRHWLLNLAVINMGERNCFCQSNSWAPMYRWQWEGRITPVGECITHQSWEYLSFQSRASAFEFWGLSSRWHFPVLKSISDQFTALSRNTSSWRGARLYFYSLRLVRIGKGL